MEVRKRIAEVCDLKSGWLNGQGEAIWVNPVFAESVARALEAAGLSGFSIYPSCDGEVIFEWPDGREIAIDG